MKLGDDLERVPVTSAQLRVLLAVDHLHAHTGRCTIRDLTVATGLRSLSTVHSHLAALRRKGLVTWTPDAAGTLRPTVSSFTTNPKDPTP